MSSSMKKLVIQSLPSMILSHIKTEADTGKLWLPLTTVMQQLEVMCKCAK